ncbi:MAG TPA: hypothetical protein VKW70_10210 [Terriglobia bacterium]|nr:hypothetical protein [Terriglobia bacterium]
MKKAAKKPEEPGIDAGFDRVVNAFARDRQVSRGEGKGFGSGALKVNGRIFAMISSKGEFVVKLPKERVDELVSAGQGRRFDPGHGRLMKEWFVADKRGTDWVDLAKEAREFAKQ